MRASPLLRLIICVGERCDARGRARQKLCEIESALATRFNAALANGDIKISTRDCLRLCTTVPVIRLEPSGDVYAGIETNELLIEINKTLAGERS